MRIKLSYLNAAASASFFAAKAGGWEPGPLAIPDIREIRGLNLGFYGIIGEKRMNPYPTTLICTVGTSLFVPNLVRLDAERQYMTEPAAHDALGQADKQALERLGL